MTDTDTSYHSDRQPSVIRAVSHIGGFEVVTRQEGPKQYQTDVYPFGAEKPVFFGHGESAEWARMEAWRYIAGVQRRVEKRGRAA